MKNLMKLINPKTLLARINSKKSKLNKSSSLSKSSPPSFGSATSSTTSSEVSSDTSNHHHQRSITRTRSDHLVAPHHFSFSVDEAFQMMDRDGDGKITPDELRSLFSFLGGKKITDEELVDMIKEIDRDGDGCIDLDELKAAVGPVFESTVSVEEEGDDLMGAFEFFDSDNDGKISAEELYQGFLRLGDGNCTLEDCVRMIQGVDVNKDGFVCFQDFSKMMIMDNNNATIPR